MTKHLGKFEGELYATRAVYDLSLDGMLDDIGSTVYTRTREEPVTVCGYVSVPFYKREGSEQWVRVKFTDGARLLIHPTGLLPCAS